jgi:hypothetical protein
MLPQFQDRAAGALGRGGDGGEDLPMGICPPPGAAGGDAEVGGRRGEPLVVEMERELGIDGLRQRAITDQERTGERRAASHRLGELQGRCRVGCHILDHQIGQRLMQLRAVIGEAGQPARILAHGNQAQLLIGREVVDHLGDRALRDLQAGGAAIVQTCAHAGADVDQDRQAVAAHGTPMHIGLHGCAHQERQDEQLQEEQEIAAEALERGVDALVVHHLAPEHQGWQLMPFTPQLEEVDQDQRQGQAGQPSGGCGVQAERVHAIQPALRKRPASMLAALSALEAVMKRPPRPEAHSASRSW